jgi:D-alanyl-D-alanine dipeptidase
VAAGSVSGFYTKLLSHFSTGMINNLRNPFYNIHWRILIFSTFLACSVNAQDSSYTRPPVTDKWDDYKSQVKNDSSKNMVELKKMIPGIVYDLRYAGVDNFMHRRMYPPGTNITFMRLPAVVALRQVQQELNEKGLGLKIFDAYRPFAVTVKFWELVKDERYVANPSQWTQPGHCR